MTQLRKFGIEMECYHPDRNSERSFAILPEAIIAMGYRSHSANYTGRDYRVWQIKPDGSLQPYGKAIEVVSPILPGTPEGIAQATKVANLLDTQGYKVNKSCGLHVHIDTSDLSERERHAVAYRYNLHQEEIKQFLPKSRWDGTNHFAMFIAPADRRLTKLRNAVRDDGTANGTSWGHEERYVPCNLEHRGRIEFRQAAGTVNATKIVNWYKFLCDFITETVRVMRAANVAPTVEAVTAAIAAVPAVATTEIVRQEPPRIPVLRPGTDADRFTQILVNTGSITAADGRRFGWPDTRLRVTAHALRRSGADLESYRTENDQPAYRVRGYRGRPTPLHLIFTLPVTVRSRNATVSAPVAASQPTPVPRRAPMDVEAVLRTTPLLQGVAPDVAMWVEARKSVFSEDVL